MTISEREKIIERLESEIANLDGKEKMAKQKQLAKHSQIVIAELEADQRKMLFQIYKDGSWEKSDECKSFKAWAAKKIKLNIDKVLDWVTSDTIRADLSTWGIEASQWSDEAILAMKFLKGDRLKNLALKLPDNPTKEQIKEALKN